MPVLDMPLLRFVQLFFCTVQNALQAYAKGPEKVRGHKTRNPRPEKRVGHKTRHPIPKKGRSHNSRSGSQNSQPLPEKRVGHKTRDRVPEKWSVTKLATPSREKVGHKTRNPVPRRIGLRETRFKGQGPGLVNVLWVDAKAPFFRICATWQQCKTKRLY